VGDRVEVLLDVPFATDGSIPLLPETFETWGTAEVVNAERITALATDAPTGEAEVGGADAPASVRHLARDRVRYRVELRSFRTGRIDLPPLTLQVAPTSVVANQVATSDSSLPGQVDPGATAAGQPAGESSPWTTPADLGFTVTSVLPSPKEDGAVVEPRPLAPPRALPRRYLDRWIAGTLTALGALFLAFYLRRRKAGAADHALAIPPFTALQRELERLSQLDASETVHVDLSRALRHYLDGAAGIPAPERTTGEIQRLLRHWPLSPDLARGYVVLLRACDGVKFARLEVDPSVMRQRLEVAKSLAESTESELAARRQPESGIAA
jgi:hypothetical protein